MCGKIFAIVMILVSLALAVVVSVWPQERMTDVILLTRFFEAMIPVLAIGALIKYLCSCGSCRNCSGPK